eukprot:3595756-Prymnesium_polylepis.1
MFQRAERGARCSRTVLGSIPAGALKPKLGQSDGIRALQARDYLAEAERQFRLGDKADGA